MGVVALVIAGLAGDARAKSLCSAPGEEICQQGAVYRCEMAGGELALISQGRKCVVAVPQLIGTWRGTGHQTPAGASGADYPVVMVVGNGTASIDYPSLKCGGTLTQLSASGSSAQYREHISHGQDRCTDGGTVTVNLDNGRLVWSWVGVDHGKQYIVIGVLDRH
jgi:hypothetical protein